MAGPVGDGPEKAGQVTDFSGPVCVWEPEDSETCKVSLLPKKHASPFAALSICDRPPGEKDAFTMVSPDFSLLLNEMSMLDFPEKLECISRRFLGLPYKSDPLGEGPGADIDPDPLFRFDALDCMTFVEEVMGLAFSDDADDFAAVLQAIRYHRATATYAMRNHFVELDWIAENSAHGLVSDITKSIGGPLAQQIALPINRVAWVMGKKDMPQEDKFSLVSALMLHGMFSTEIAKVDYIPISAFFADGGNAGQPNCDLIAKLPEVSIILMIRKEEYAKKVGVVVSHMALLIAPKSDDGTCGPPIIRHAGIEGGVFHDELLLPYLQSQAKTRAGVAILEVLTPKE